MSPSLFTKYGRRGKPHKVMVQLDDKQKEVMWWDYGKQTAKDARKINVKEIKQLRTGADNTDVLKKHKISEELDNFFFSIICKKRTLDLFCKDPKIIQAWVSKIQTILAQQQEEFISQQMQAQQA